MAKRFFILTLAAILGMLLAGGRLTARSQAAEPEQTVTPLPEPTAAVEAAAVQTLSTEPAVPARTLRCAEIAADMDAGCIFVSDPRTGEMVYCSTAQTDKLYPASITKLFTAWVALRFLAGDEIVTVGWELGLLEPGSSSAFLALDSRLTVEDLIRGMLLPSGNDAALVLAAAVGRRIAGDKKITAGEAVAEFVAEMNRAAEALALQNSHFENPHGCHSQSHYSCPADLARIAALALEEPLIRNSMGLSQLSVTIVSGETHTWTNTNHLVRPEDPQYCPEALGMKTGYTEAAGYCLLAAFDAGEPLVVGIFGSGDSASRYENAVRLYRACLTEEPAVQTAAFHEGIQGGAGDQKDDGLAGGYIGGVDPEGAADID